MESGPDRRVRALPEENVSQASSVPSLNPC